MGRWTGRQTDSTLGNFYILSLKNYPLNCDRKDSHHKGITQPEERSPRISPCEDADEHSNENHMLTAAEHLQLDEMLS